MTKKLRTVQQVMELCIQHHIPAGQEMAAGDELSQEARLEAYLDTLPSEFAAALRAEMSRGTLVVTLVPRSGGRPRPRRSGERHD